MSLRLKNESTTFPPGGLQFEDRQLRWKNTINDPVTVWSWDGLVNAVYNLRKANAARFPKLSLDRTVIRQQISEQNARRIMGSPGWETYVLQEGVAGGGASPSPLPHNASLLQSVVGHVESLARGFGSLLEWWVKEEGTPVDQALANNRAFICVAGNNGEPCPKNNQEGMSAWFTKPLQAWIQKKIEARKNLKLETPHDEKLGICAACTCPLKLAVHQPIEIKRKNLSEQAKADLWEKCWARLES